MSVRCGPIYEVTLSIDQGVAADIDDWLAEHVAEMLELPGFTEAKVFALEDEDERVRRVTHYYLESDAALEQSLAGPAAHMRQATVEKFSDRFDASRRVLYEARGSSNNAEPDDHCPNCNAVMTGQYCGQCGQRAQSRLISIWELLRDAFGDLLELDSKIWQTLLPLATRPGQLTRNYLQGRRARFMPPFRTYLVLSLLFFLIAFFDPRQTMGILFEEEPAPSTEQAEAERRDREELLRELAEEGILVPSGRSGADEGSEKDELTLSTQRSSDSGAPECNFANFGATEMPAWLSRRLTEDRLQTMCTRLVAEDGSGLRGVRDKLLENLPAGLFVLLPVMALILNLLYPLSRRYYVEHLLFVIHYHAFIFLALIFQVLWSRFAALIRLPEFVTSIVAVPLLIYSIAYLYVALRRVYEQGRLPTLLKFTLLLVAYIVGLTLIMVVAAIFAAFSI